MVTKAYAHEGFYYMIEGVCMSCVCCAVSSVFACNQILCSEIPTYMWACGLYLQSIHVSLYKKIF